MYSHGDSVNHTMHGAWSYHVVVSGRDEHTNIIIILLSNIMKIVQKGSHGTAKIYNLKDTYKHFLRLDNCAC